MRGGWGGWRDGGQSSAHEVDQALEVGKSLAKLICRFSSVGFRRSDFPGNSQIRPCVHYLVGR
jgi:hypothetical protein